MNRRTFIQTIIGSALTAAAFPALAWDFEQTEIKDLILWAPYEPFMPDQVNPTIENPGDGTQNGILKAADIVNGTILTLRFWHEHGGVYHQFTITPDHFTSLKSGHPVIIHVPTTVVEDHYHMIVIDPARPA